MTKFVEIKESNLCPICKKRLFYRHMPIRSYAEMHMNSESFPCAWHCGHCDKYFEEQSEEASDDKQN